MATLINNILDFISRFQGSENTFLHGCCYWFAYILREEYGAEILYEPVEGHFLSSLTIDEEPHLFDIRGDVTELYLSKPLYTIFWLRQNEPGWYHRILRDCRHFLSPADETLKTA